MRTTLTLDPDVAARLKKLVDDGGLSFKEAVNDALRRGLTGGAVRPRKVWSQRVWPDGGSRMLVAGEALKDQLDADEAERFLETTRRQSPAVRD
ncbi:MAG: ribbon-helix-helix protein, CopG family [Vicinamibacterales bacterium]